MIINSFQFLYLFPIIFVVYYLILCWRNKDRQKLTKISNAFLLMVSYGVYIKWKPVYALVLLWVTLVTYLGAIIIEKSQTTRKKPLLIATGVTLGLLPLAIFKYYNFVTSNLEVFLNACGVTTGIPSLDIIMPLGISFFSLQAVGYLCDVYYKRIEAERNWWDYMLFVSFFPQIASGPISKAKDMLPQIKNPRAFNYDQAVQGLKWILWGMFIKVVVADKLGLRVDLVYNSYETYSGFECLFASILYTLQLYCDFAGYSFMALGVGNVLGFDLVNNFQRPFFSMSITEFWGRWHISLSTWLKDYVYIPLGGSRCSKERNYLNIFLTFIVSGLWHGANWTYIVWGAIHGVVQIVEKAFGLIKIQSTGFIKFIRVILTFSVFSFSLIFFRSPSLLQAMDYISRFDVVNVIPTILSYSFVLALSALVLFKDLADEYQWKSVRFLHHEYTIVRWLTYIFLISFIAIEGVYGGQFIYAGF